MPRWAGGGGSGGVTTTVAAYGSEPASPSLGDLNYPPGAPFYQRYDGSSWVAYEKNFNQPLTTPPTSGWTWYNQTVSGSSASEDATYGGRKIIVPGVSGTQVRMRGRAVPATPWTLTALVKTVGHPGVNLYNSAGVAIHDTVSGRVIIAGHATYLINCNKYSSFSAFSASAYDANSGEHLDQLWVRATDNGTNLSVAFSRDNVSYITVLNESRTAFLTSGPNVIGWFGKAENASWGITSWLLSWGVT